MPPPLIRPFLGPKGFQHVLLLALLAAVAIFYLVGRNHLAPRQEHGEGDTARGLVIEFQSNGIGDVDALSLRSGGENLVLKFPPHTASKVMHVAKPNDQVEAVFRKDKKHPHDARGKLEILTNVTTGQRVVVADIPPPIQHETGPEIEVILPEKAFHVDRKGRINGFVTARQLIEIKPDVMNGLLSVIHEAKQIKVKGFKRDEQAGFVNLKKMELVKAVSLELDGRTYLLY